MPSPSDQVDGVGPGSFFFFILSSQISDKSDNKGHCKLENNTRKKGNKGLVNTTGVSKLCTKWLHIHLLV